MGNPILRYESGQAAQAFAAMSDSGDRTTFEAAFAPISLVSGFAPVIAPYGVKSGGAASAGSGNNEVDIAALVVLAPGMTGANAMTGLLAVAADTVSITRPDTAVAKVCSIVVTSAGELGEVEGTDGADTTFSETRNVAGGPPLIPDGAIEVAQVRVTSNTAAPITAAEIFQTPGQHQERFDNPVYLEPPNYAEGEITFAEALPAIHTGGIPKQVWIRGYTPIFATLTRVSDFTPAETSHSVSSTDTYDGPKGQASQSINQASWNVILSDGMSENFIQQKNKNIWVEYRNDRDVSLPKQLTQGLLGVTRSNPAGGGSPTAACTLTAENPTLDVLA